MHYNLTFGVDTIDDSPRTIEAMKSARTFFESNPNDTLILLYPAGEYNFMANEPNIDFGSSIELGENGRRINTGCRI